VRPRCQIQAYITAPCPEGEWHLGRHGFDETWGAAGIELTLYSHGSEVYGEHDKPGRATNQPPASPHTGDGEFGRGRAASMKEVTSHVSAELRGGGTYYQAPSFSERSRAVRLSLMEVSARPPEIRERHSGPWYIHRRRMVLSLAVPAERSCSAQ